MKKLNSPSVDMNLSEPRYDEIASIVKKMRASASPCPFDQVSIIVFKKCPIMRTILWRITLREESNAEKSPAEQKKCGIKECEFGPKFTFFYSAFFGNFGSFAFFYSAFFGNFGSFAIFYSAFSKF